MGKTDHEQHQIDKNHYCSVTLWKDSETGNRLIPCSDYKTLVQHDRKKHCGLYN